MKFMLIFMCLCCVLNSNAYRQSNTLKNNTSTTRLKLGTKRSIDVSMLETNFSTAYYESLNKSEVTWNVLNECIWLIGGYYDYSTGECVCYRTFVRVEKKCLAIKAVIGDTCVDSKQCNIPHSECIYNRCRCKNRYIYQTSNNKCTFFETETKSNTLIIILCIIFAIIIAAAMIVSTIFFKRKITDIRSRLQNSRVQQTNENIESSITWTPRYPESIGYGTSSNTLETALENLDKPPSYEEIMKTSKSMCTLMNQQVSPDEPCPSYSIALRHMRSRSSSM